MANEASAKEPQDGTPKSDYDQLSLASDGPEAPVFVLADVATEQTFISSATSIRNRAEIAGNIRAFGRRYTEH